MSATIQDCADLSAEERREQRRQRVLLDADERLKQLLELNNFPDKPDAKADEVSHVSSVRAEDAVILNEINEEAEEVVADPKPNLNFSELGFILPNYWSAIESIRVYVLMAAGFGHYFVNERFEELFHTDLALYVWSVIFAVFYIVKSYLQGERFPRHGYIVNFLLVAGINELIARYAGFCIDTLWNIWIDMCIMLTGVVLARLSTQLVSYVY